MTKIKVSELTGAALDWAVAKCESTEVWAGPTVDQTRHTKTPVEAAVYSCDGGEAYSPSTDWAHGGPIIERMKIELSYWHMPPEQMKWAACDNQNLQYVSGEYVNGSDFQNFGPTPLIAAMRCFCCSKFGDVVDIPEELK